MERLFNEYCKELDLDWYEVFDSELLDDFISKYNINTDSQDYQDWYEELAMDL